MNKELEIFIRTMPKIELHVHLEGSVNPETLLTLAKKNGISLPAASLEEIREWYVFKDFSKFVEVYLKISECIQTPDDLELITREFLKDRKEQNILYTEVTFTPYTHFTQKNMPFSDQLAALERARVWGLKALGVDCRFIMDINREVTPEEGEITARWLLKHQDSSIAALGLGGAEGLYPPERHHSAFALIKNSRIHSIPHAGEMAGPESVRGALDLLNAERLGHGVRSWEDPELVALLAEKEIVLEVCPTSNICLNVYDSLEKHVLPQLVKAGVKVTINSDDPPMFNTTLTEEYLKCADAFGFGKEDLFQFNMNAINGCFLPTMEKKILNDQFLAANQQDV